MHTGARLLHVGCGGAPMPEWAIGRYDEVRLDISPDHKPDVLASMTDMGAIGPFDALYSSHSLEHLRPEEVAVALAEFRRVLTDGGFALIIVPDCEGVEPTEEVLFTAPCGPITGLDLFHGLRSVLDVLPHMAHHSQFTAEALSQAITGAGFATVKVQRLANYNLMAVAVK